MSISSPSALVEMGLALIILFLFLGQRGFTYIFILRPPAKSQEAASRLSGRRPGVKKFSIKDAKEIAESDGLVDADLVI